MRRMSVAAAGVLAAAMVFGWPGGRIDVACAGEGAVIEKLSDADAEKILRRMGFEFEKKRDDCWAFRMDDLKVVLFNKGKNMQLYAGFRQKASLKAINEWNKTKRFSRAYLDNVDDAVIEADLDFEGGVTEKNIEAFIRTFRISLTVFAKHIRAE